MYPVNVVCIFASLITIVQASRLRHQRISCCERWRTWTKCWLRLVIGRDVTSNPLIHRTTYRCAYARFKRTSSWICGVSWRISIGPKPFYFFSTTEHATGKNHCTYHLYLTNRNCTEYWHWRISSVSFLQGSHSCFPKVPHRTAMIVLMKLTLWVVVELVFDSLEPVRSCPRGSRIFHQGSHV